METSLMPVQPLNLFLDLLLHEKPDDAYVLIWTIDGKEKRSYWIQEKGRISAKVIELHEQGRHIYIGCGWTLKEYGAFNRATAQQINGINALWFDADVAHIVHKKDNLPPTIQSVVNALKTITPEPSIVVGSGYGLHLWWLFEQPWMFSGEEDRKLAAQLSHAWHKYIESRFKGLGWSCDTTSDLSRILRLPGTYNYKVLDDPKLVDILYTSETRYTPDALRAWLNENDRGQITTLIPREALSGGGNFHLNPNANPPLDKWEELKQIDIRVQLTWSHKRGTDLKDQSQSGYDASLAVWGVMGGFTDQEIVDLIVANRRFFKADLMLENRQYYERTLAYARRQKTEGFEFTDDEKDIREILEKTDIEYAREPLTEDKRQKALRILSRWIDVGELDLSEYRKKKGKDGDDLESTTPSEKTTTVALTNIICYTRDPAVYYLEVYNREGELRRVKVGDGNDIRDQKKWSRVIWDERGHDTRTIQKKDWQLAIRLIARVMQRESPGEESTEGGMVIGWIRDFTGPDVPICVDSDARYERLKTMAPFIENDKIHISMPLLAQYLRTHRGKNIDERDLSVMLRGIGGGPKDINFMLKGEKRRQQRRYWMIPWGDKRESYSDGGSIKEDGESGDSDVVEITEKFKEYNFEDV